MTSWYHDIMTSFILVDAGVVARVAQCLGAGRDRPGATLDLSAGVVVGVAPGDWVEQGQEWAVLHHGLEVGTSCVILP